MTFGGAERSRSKFTIAGARRGLVFRDSSAVRELSTLAPIADLVYARSSASSGGWSGEVSHWAAGPDARSKAALRTFMAWHRARPTRSRRFPFSTGAIPARRRGREAWIQSRHRLHPRSNRSAAR